MASLNTQQAIAIPSPEYPIRTQQTAGFVGGVPTDILALSFTDKILITITQGGRLAQWMQVPLFTNDPNRAEHFLPPASDTDETSLLPLSHLTASTLLGGSNPEREMVGQLYATQIASAIVARNPEEKRTVLVGLGLEKVERSREAFFDLVELVGRVL